MKRLEQLDSYELRTAMLFAWLFAFALFGFVVTMQLPGWDFAPFPLAVFAIMSFAEILHWGYKAFARQNANDASNETEYAESAESVQPAGLTDEQLKEREYFYGFIYGVCVRNMVSENQWAALAKDDALAYITRTHFRYFMPYLQRAGVVSEVSAGGKRRVMMNFTDALGAIEIASGEENYWDKAGCGHHTLINPNRNPSPIEVAGKPQF